jgi:hypothetical protein
MLPPPARLQVPQWQPHAPDQHADNIRAIDRCVNDLPIPCPNVTNTGVLGAWSSSSTTNTPWAASGGYSAGNLTFRKQFAWTDIFVQIDTTTKNSGAGLIVVTMDIAIQTAAERSAGSSTFTATYINHRTIDPGKYRELSGFTSISGMAAGVYYGELQCRLGPSGTMATDGNCSGALLIMEVPPAP